MFTVAITIKGGCVVDVQQPSNVEVLVFDEDSDEGTLVFTFRDGEAVDREVIPPRPDKEDLWVSP